MKSCFENLEEEVLCVILQIDVLESQKDPHTNAGFEILSQNRFSLRATKFRVLFFKNFPKIKTSLDEELQPVALEKKLVLIQKDHT